MSCANKSSTNINGINCQIKRLQVKQPTYQNTEKTISEPRSGYTDFEIFLNPGAFLSETVLHPEFGHNVGDACFKVGPKLQKSVLIVKETNSRIGRG